MKLKRYKNIVAFTNDEQSFWALQSENLDFAEISKEVWQQMSPIEFSTSNIPEILHLRASDTSDALEALDSLNEWNIASEAEQNSALSLSSPLSKNFPQSFTLNISQICNLGCKYCVAGGDGTYGNPIKKIDVARTVPQLEFFLKKIPQGQKARLSYLGGEPLLYPEVLFAIVEYVDQVAKERGLKVFHTLITNATLLTPEIAQRLAKHNFDITVSIDGPAHENDELRPFKQKTNKETSTEKTLQGLQSLSEVKSNLREITLHSVFSRKDQNLVAAYEFFSSLPVDLFEFTLDIHTNDEDLMWAYLSQMSLVLKAAFARGGETELKKIHIVSKFFNTLDQKKKTYNYCGSGKSFISIDADNRVYSCPLEVNTVQKSVGKDLNLQEENLTGRTQTLIEANSCQSCWARYFCGGGCMYIHNHLTGSKHKKDKIFCIKTRHLLADTLLYYKQCRT